MYTLARRYFNRKYQAWLDRRLPKMRACRLDNSKLFIFPSLEGLLFLGVLVLLWLTATNYENNLIFGFTFLLVALFVISIFHTYANLHGIEVVAIKGLPGFAGDVLEFEVQLKQDKARLRDNLRLCYPGGDAVVVRMLDTQTMIIKLPVEAQRRGWLVPGRLSISSVFPLGLVRTWTHLRLDYQALVYPRPSKGVVASKASAGRGEGDQDVVGGSEDFFGLVKYQPGEPQSHIAWKQYARELGLHSKRYSDPVEKRIWLDWDDFPGLDTEARLSRLCGMALEVSLTQQRYGLRLPGVEISPARGDGHREIVLRALALFKLEDLSAENSREESAPGNVRGNAGTNAGGSAGAKGGIN